MNLKLIALSAFSVSAISTFIPGVTPSAKAVCVLTDVGVQIAVHGRNTTANQNNNVNQQASNDCYNNSITTTGVQVYTGKGSVNQIRNSNQYAGGGYNPTGVNIKPIKVNVPVRVSVPALP